VTKFTAWANRIRFAAEGQPGSRTVKLLAQGCLEAAKLKNDSFTVTSVKPEREIDFILVSPPSKWSVVKTQVIDEPLIFDHRPVVADLMAEFLREPK
jgi:endonuclease/exonuclease/phosphatase family metal-dependent hydrolase